MVGVVILFSSALNTPSFTSEQYAGARQRRWAWLSFFSQMCRSRSDLIENAEHFARINVDLSDVEKERNQCHANSRSY